MLNPCLYRKRPNSPGQIASNLILEMADLDQKIANLEARVATYEAQLDVATSRKEKKRLSDLISNARETLNRQLDRMKMSFPQGNKVLIMSFDLYLMSLINHRSIV